MHYLLEFLVAVINHCHINGLYLIWDSFEWLCLKKSYDTKSFSSLVQGSVIDD